MFSYKNVGRPLVVTVSDKPSKQKDLKMKLICVFVSILALAIADDPDLETAATMELMKLPAETLETAASNYQPNTETFNSQNNYAPTQNRWDDSQNDYASVKYAPSNNYRPQNSYVPQNAYVPPQNNYVPPQNNYVPPQNNYYPPNNNWNQPQNTWPSTYYPTTSTTTTPIPVIKNELTYGDNGSYKYEYEIADGTHVGEEGYFTNPKGDEESIVKKGWYSYRGSDGKVYTVTWWADHSGFHATGDHLPTPPPIPPAIQASIEQNAKEEAAKAEAEKNKPQTGYYPPQQTYYPTQPAYNPPQPTYNPPQNNYYPTQPAYNPSQTYYPQAQQPNRPSYGK